MIFNRSNDRKKPNKHRLSGFALPTILIASIIMLSVLLVSVASTVAMRVSLSAQTFNQLADNAGDAGLAYAKACLDASGGVPTWTDAKPLTPSTDCSGNQLAGFTCPDGTADSRCAVTVNGGAIAQFLVVGGGGGGSTAGGGGGGYLINTETLLIGTIPVTVGLGGLGTHNVNPPQDPGNNGENSVFGAWTAVGGGGGGPLSATGLAGGSGGGGGVAYYGGVAAGTDGQGNHGGLPAGGGGGAGGVGGNGIDNVTGGTGGVGLNSSISGTATGYAGGGGGGSWVGGSGSGTASHGGGAGNVVYGEGYDGTANTGGGGGGAGYGAVGGDGGSGVVIVSYPVGSITATPSGTYTDLSNSTNTVYKFTGGGSLNSLNVTATSASATVVTSTFSVGLPSVVAGKANEINSVGSSKLLKTSDSTVWRRYNQSSRLTIPFTPTPVTAIGSITGTTTVGQTLTAGAITPGGATVSYQWQSSATSGGTYTNIGGATSNTYTLVSGDIGNYIKVVATGTNYYSGSATSAASTVVAGGSFSATGGTITYTDSSGLNPRSSPAYAGGYTVHTFTAGGTFTVTGSGNVVALVVAGGGAGGNVTNSGGGGAGGLIYNASFGVTAQAYPITVGLGGITAGSDGSNSIFSTLTAIAGGGGGIGSQNGRLGGSGGGAGSAGGNMTGGAGTAGQGYAGGNSTSSWFSSGGGGAGGASAAFGYGPGLAYSISGASVTYATGGPGSYLSGSAAAANTGNGGLGRQTGLISYGGGSGIIIIRYLSP